MGARRKEIISRNKRVADISRVVVSHRKPVEAVRWADRRLNRQAEARRCREPSAASRRDVRRRPPRILAETVAAMAATIAVAIKVVAPVAVADTAATSEARSGQSADNASIARSAKKPCRVEPARLFHIAFVETRLPEMRAFRLI